jgi:hypothetical protein
MFPGSRGFAKSLIFGSLTAASMLALSSRATAETSVHKLKKRLHQAEHTSGVVLSTVGDALLGGLVDLASGISFEPDDGDGRSWTAAPAPGKTTPATGHLPYFTNHGPGTGPGK